MASVNVGPLCRIGSHCLPYVGSGLLGLNGKCLATSSASYFFLRVCVHVHLWVYARRGQNHWIPLELELQVGGGAGNQTWLLCNSSINS